MKLEKVNIFDTVYLFTYSSTKVHIFFNNHFLIGDHLHKQFHRHMYKKLLVRQQVTPQKIEIVI